MAYLVTEMDCVGEGPVRLHESLEDALSHRDELQKKADHRQRMYRVIDADDGERVNAEWCVECGEVGTFGSECPECKVA